MTSRQGKVIVLAAVAVLTALLLRQAVEDGGWVAFAVTEVQILVPMSLSWWVLSRGDASR